MELEICLLSVFSLYRVEFQIFEISLVSLEMAKFCSTRPFNTSAIIMLNCKKRL